MSKRRLVLDINDVVLNTENFIRKTLGGKWLNHEGCLYMEYSNMSLKEMGIVYNIFSDYSKIPYVPGAKEGLKILSLEYDIEFCSSCWTDIEGEAKKRWAEDLGIPLTLCKGYSKGKIDMSGATFVDDGTRNLNSSNADRKVCFYKKYCFINLDEGEVVFNWFELLDKLCPEYNNISSLRGLCSINGVYEHLK